MSLASCEPLLHQIKTRFSSFWCASFVLPKACVNKINSMCSAFLLKGNLEANNTARVAWSTVVKKKKEGGLGVKDLQTWNKACCLRLIWLLFFRPDSVWVTPWFIWEYKMGNVADSGLTIGVFMGVCENIWMVVDHDLEFHKMQHWPLFIVMERGGFLRGEIQEVDWSSAVWTSRSIPRQSFRAWLVVQNMIPTRDRLISWGPSGPFTMPPM